MKYPREMVNQARKKSHYWFHLPMLEAFPRYWVTVPVNKSDITKPWMEVQDWETQLCLYQQHKSKVTGAQGLVMFQHVATGPLYLHLLIRGLEHSTEETILSPKAYSPRLGWHTCHQKPWNYSYPSLGCCQCFPTASSPHTYLAAKF